MLRVSVSRRHLMAWLIGYCPRKVIEASPVKTVRRKPTHLIPRRLLRDCPELVQELAPA